MYFCDIRGLIMYGFLNVLKLWTHNAHIVDVGFAHAIHLTATI